MAGANRLQLDFKLVTTEERAAFLEQYLHQPQFTTRPPTEDELETMGNYVLWGKDPSTGLNAKQTKLIDIETKYKTWDKNSNTESLEALMEMPTFNEGALTAIGGAVVTKIPRQVFDRKEALRECPDYLRQTFEELFAQIDELDLSITFYELAHNRREKPARESLTCLFTEEEQNILRERASTWTPYKYLKMRHRLVELRREAYILRDGYHQTIQSHGHTAAITQSAPQIGSEVEVLPLGLADDSKEARLIFRNWENLVPTNFSPEEEQTVSDLVWKKEKYQLYPNQFYIDFRELEHVYEMLQAFYELEDAAAFAEFGSNLPALMNTLNFYIQQADLTELQREILDLKIQKKKNVDIASAINKKWGKTYTPNYISTIFRQRIIPKINEAAKYHQKIVSKIFFEEEFKTCSCCGRTLLRDPENFTRKSRSADGLTARCKQCEKKARAAAKENL